MHLSTNDKQAKRYYQEYLNDMGWRELQALYNKECKDLQVVIKAYEDTPSDVLEKASNRLNKSISILHTMLTGVETC